MIKVGITGQSGFIGTNIFNQFNLKKDEILLIPFDNNYFKNISLLKDWIKKCDVIIHLAGVNRLGNPDEIYKTNIDLVNKLIEALNETGTKPHVIFSSSTQEENNNPYGKSKKEGRQMLENWAQENNALFTGMIIPNVFGPFGEPFYNSVIATFSHQLIHEQQPQIHVDNEINLIFVQELADVIYDIILGEIKENPFSVPHTSRKRVSEILKLLNNYKKSYIQSLEIPAVSSDFEKNLFNTFRSYIDPIKFFPVKLIKNSDTRGSFYETVKSNTGGQFSFSTTNPGITRGNHYHSQKIERFIVIKGDAVIKLRKINTSEILEFKLSGNEPAFVDIPIWYTHNITNIGTDELLTLFWTNEFFDPANPDTYYEEI